MAQAYGLLPISRLPVKGIGHAALPSARCSTADQIMNADKAKGNGELTFDLLAYLHSL